MPELEAALRQFPELVKVGVGLVVILVAVFALSWAAVFRS